MWVPILATAVISTAFSYGVFSAVYRYKTNRLLNNITETDKELDATFIGVTAFPSDTSDKLNALYVKLFQTVIDIATVLSEFTEAPSVNGAITRRANALLAEGVLCSWLVARTLAQRGKPDQKWGIIHGKQFISDNFTLTR